MGLGIDGQRVVRLIAEAEHFPSERVLLHTPEALVVFLEGLFYLRIRLGPQIAGPSVTVCIENKGAGIHMAVVAGCFPAFESKIPFVRSPLPARPDQDDRYRAVAGKQCLTFGRGNLARDGKFRSHARREDGKAHPVAVVKVPSAAEHGNFPFKKVRPGKPGREPPHGV